MQSDTVILQLFSLIDKFSKMKKDIQVPPVTGIEIAIVLEPNAEGTKDWNVYVINNKEVAIEMIVIVSQGFSETKKTSVFRRRVDFLAPKTAEKFEMMQPELFDLDNRFQVSFFEGNQIHEKTFIFEATTIQEGFFRNIDVLNIQGVSCK